MSRFGEWEEHSIKAKIIGGILMLILMPAFLIYINQIEWLGIYLFGIGSIALAPYILNFATTQHLPAKIRVIGLIGILLLSLGIAFQFNFLSLQSVVYSAIGECQIARPYFGSINCEIDPQPSTKSIRAGSVFGVGNKYSQYFAKATGFMSLGDPTKPQVFSDGCNGDHVPVLQLTDRNDLTGVEQTYDLCKGIPLLGYVQRPSYYDCYNGMSTPFYTIGLKNVPIHDLHQYTLKVWCITSALPGGKWYKATNSDNFFVQYKYQGEQFKTYFDSAHGIPLQNTRGCKSQDLWNAYYEQYNKDLKKEQLNSFNLQKVADSINRGIMSVISFLPGQGSSNIPQQKGYVVDKPFDAKAGDAFAIVTDWKPALPGLTTYKYQGQDVWCDPAGGYRNHRLITFEQINTGFNNEGYCYKIPTKTILTNVECCSSGECQSIFQDKSYKCDLRGDNPTFTCKKTVECSSDIDCGTQSYCYSQNGKYYTRGGSCVNGKCTDDVKEVKCCPSGSGGPECPAGTFCKPEGCVSEIQQCPPNACCLTGKEYTYQQCSSNQPVCCPPTTNPNLGWCKKTQEECSGIPPKCETFDIGCHLRGVFSGLFNIQIPMPSFDISVMGGLTGAVLLGLLGFVVGGPIGAVLGAVIGVLLGWGIAGILDTLRPFIALLAIILGSNYSYDWEILKKRLTNKDYRLIVAIILGIIAGIAVWINYWFGIALLLVYFILKLLWKIYI